MVFNDFVILDGQLRTSRSDTSLNGTGFEVITDSEVREIKAASNPAPYVPTKRSRHVLKEGISLFKCVTTSLT